MMIYLISVNAFIILTHLLFAQCAHRRSKKNLSREHLSRNKDIGMKLLDVGLAPSTKRAECTHKEIREGFKLG